MSSSSAVIKKDGEIIIHPERPTNEALVLDFLDFFRNGINVLKVASGPTAAPGISYLWVWVDRDPGLISKSADTSVPRPRSL